MTASDSPSPLAGKGVGVRGLRRQARFRKAPDGAGPLVRRNSPSRDGRSSERPTAPPSPARGEGSPQTIAPPRAEAARRRGSASVDAQYRMVRRSGCVFQRGGDVISLHSRRGRRPRLDPIPRSVGRRLCRANRSRAFAQTIESRHPRARASVHRNGESLLHRLRVSFDDR